MVSYDPNTVVYLGDGTVFFEGFCLSTDTKPTTGIANGSSLREMDTTNTYHYDADSEAWIVPTGG